MRYFTYVFLKPFATTQGLRNGTRFRDQTCPCEHAFKGRTFLAFLMNRVLSTNNNHNNNIPAFTKFGTCIVNVLCQLQIKHYMVQLFIVECNLSVTIKNHLRTRVCIYVHVFVWTLSSFWNEKLILGFCPSILIQNGVALFCVLWWDDTKMDYMWAKRHK